MRAFVDAGPALAPLLQKAARAGIVPAYAGAILHALAANPENAGAEDTRISGRELEVLRLMAEGLSNQAIGEKLTLSTGTVKTHVHNVITKLGAANRTEAVANARTRGLI